MKIFPSLISSDLLYLGQNISKLDNYVEGFHIDVMDDHFVPNLTWGPAFVKAIISCTDKPIVLHLMVTDPFKWLERVPLRTKDIFVFHYEAVEKIEIDKVFNFLKRLANFAKVGMAVNPETPIEKIFKFLSYLDFILLMSVNPGFSGQKYIEDVEKKIGPLLEVRNKNKLSFEIGMDGGIDKSNIGRLVAMGVMHFGIASAIFSKKDWIEAIIDLREFKRI